MTVPHAAPPDLLVLHTLRCCGASSADRIAEALAAVISDDVEGVLLGLAAAGLVTHDRGTFGGWRVTDAGREADAARISSELDEVGARNEVQHVYDQFLPLNQRTLDVCGAWQVRSFKPMVLNDHSDARYDAQVLARLAAVHAEVQPLCELLSAQLHRFSHYAPRLASALQRARDGEVDRVTDSLDSYHSVWFQLHEDLLVTLGIPRQA